MTLQGKCKNEYNFYWGHSSNDLQLWFLVYPLKFHPQLVFFSIFLSVPWDHQTFTSLWHSHLDFPSLCPQSLLICVHLVFHRKFSFIRSVWCPPVASALCLSLCFPFYINTYWISMACFFLLDLIWSVCWTREQSTVLDQISRDSWKIYLYTNTLSHIL